MATHVEITESLQAFQKSYQENEKLKLMNKDWNRTVLVLANDIESVHTLILNEGELTLQEGRQGEPDLTVTSSSDILVDMFFGDIAPYRALPQRRSANYWLRR